MWFTKFVIVLCVFAAPVHFCVAQDDDAPKKSEQKLEEMTVYGRAEPKPERLFDVDHEAYSGFVKTIENTDLQYSFVTLPNLINRQTGIQVRQAAGMGGYSSTSIRASDGKHVNIFLDGMLLNSQGRGSFNLNLIPAGIVETINIYPDITPIQFGNASMAGAVNIKTLDFAGKQGGKLTVSHGSYNSSKLDVAYFDQWDGLQLLTAAGVTHSNQDYTFLSHGNRPDVPENATEKELYNNAHKAKNLLFKAATNDHHLLLQAASTQKELPVIDSASNSHTNNAYSDNALANMQWGFQQQFNKFEVAHRLFYGISTGIFRDPHGQYGKTGPKHYRSEDQQFGYNVLSQLAAANHTFSTLLEYSGSQYQEKDRTENRTTADTSRSSVLVGLQDDWFIWDNDLQISIAARNQYNKSNGDYVKDRIQEDAADTTNHTSYQLGAIKTLSDFFTLKINASKQFRQPGLIERYGTKGQMIGNPELKEEKSHNYDVGIIFNKTSFKSGLVYFQKEPKDLIFIMYNTQGIGHPENIGKSTIRGVETELFWNPSHFFSFTGKYTFLDTSNNSKTKAARVSDLQIPGIYHETAFVELVSHFYSTQVILSALMQDDLYYDSGNSDSVKPPRKELLNLNIRWKEQDHTIDLLLSNLLDQQFEDFNGLPAPGFSAFLTWSYDI